MYISIRYTNIIIEFFLEKFDVTIAPKIDITNYIPNDSGL